MEGVGKTTPEASTVIVERAGPQKFTRGARGGSATVAQRHRRRVAAISPAELRHNRLDKFTESGLEIEAGFKPSPGDALAGSFGGGSPIGAAQTREAVEHVELGRAHPGLEAGGAGTADGIRREGGLPVPSRVATSGGIVDLPAGEFLGSDDSLGRGQRTLGGSFSANAYRRTDHHFRGLEMLP